MSVAYNPKIVTDGLVLALDAANRKSYNIPLPTEHGWSDWYCMVSGTATYSIVDTGVSIYQRTSAGVVTTVVSASTGPTRGTVNVTADNFYYGDGPINIIVEDGHQCLVPLTVAGTLFWNYTNRLAPLTVYIYSPFGNATVNYFENTVSGVSSAATSSVSVTQGTATTYTTSNLGNLWITSNKPIIVTSTCSGGDKTIVHPMASYVYRRYAQFAVTSLNGTPNSSTYVVYDTVNKAMDVTIADGAGSESNQGLGLEYLSDTYSWGNYLTDYVIVAPYDNTAVKVEYWNTATNTWVIQEIHNLTGGTITNPAQVQRDGSAGIGVTATNINGTAAFFGTSQLWRWSANNPFYLAINDTADDEFTLLGWTQASYSARPRAYNKILDLSGNGNIGTLINRPTYSNANGGSLVFDGTNDYIECSGTAIKWTQNGSVGFTNITVEFWIKVNADQGRIFSKPWNGGGQYNIDINESTFGLWSGASSAYLAHPVSIGNNTWRHVTCWANFANMGTYVNGTQYSSTQAHGLTGGIGSSGDSSLPLALMTLYPYGTGWAGNAGFSTLGEMSICKVYNRVLSAAEIQQNFNAIRGRYGI